MEGFSTICPSSQSGTRYRWYISVELIPTSKIAKQKKWLETYKSKSEINFSMLSQDGQVPSNSTYGRTPCVRPIISENSYQTRKTRKVSPSASYDPILPLNSGIFTDLVFRYIPSRIDYIQTSRYPSGNQELGWEFIQDPLQYTPYQYHWS